MALTTINSGGVKDDSIVNADIKSDAAIAGTKVAPNFGSQNIVTTGTVGSGDLTITSSAPFINFIDSDHNSDFNIQINGGGLNFNDTTNSATRMSIDSSGNVGIGIDPDGYYSDKLVLNCAGEDGITLKNTTGDTTNYIMFANASSGAGRYAGWISYAHANNWMRITVNDDTAGKYFTFKSNGDLELGHGNLKVPAGQGINFSNYGAEEDPNSALTGIYDNLLDDYESGIWYPTLSSGTATWYNARYVKIGKLVQIWARFEAPTDDSTATAIAVLSLPFACEYNNAGGSCFAKHVSNVDTTTVYINTSEELSFYGNHTTNNWNRLNYSHCNSANTSIYFHASYRSVA